MTEANTDSVQIILKNSTNTENQEYIHYYRPVEDIDSIYNFDSQFECCNCKDKRQACSMLNVGKDISFDRKGFKLRYYALCNICYPDALANLYNKSTRRDMIEWLERKRNVK